MRSTIVLLILFLLPGFVLGHWWFFVNENQPDLMRKADEAMTRSGVRNHAVTMDYFNARISGVTDTLEQREEAARAVRAIAGIQLSPSDNLIAVPARLQHTLEEKKLAVEGLLPGDQALEALETIVAERRPDITLDISKIRTSPVIVLGVPQPDGSPAPLTDRHNILRPLLETIRVPASLEIMHSESGLTVKGHLPTDTLRQSVIEALRSNTAGLPVDAQELVSSRFIEQTDFTDEVALPAFLRSFFKLRVPGEFSVSQGQPPRLTATVTRAIEAEWLALLRPVSGASKIDARLTIVPSPVHLPGYKPASPLPPGTLDALSEALKRATITFDPGSYDLPPVEEVKLAAAMPYILASGPDLMLLVCGYDDPQSTPDAARSLNRARAEVIIAKLTELGLSTNEVEIAQYEAREITPDTTPEERIEMARQIDLIVK
jgi:outer membrane protein OmpA-like peptidoglycan-associated protein